MPRILLYLGVLLSLDLVVEKSAVVSSSGVSDVYQVHFDPMDADASTDMDDVDTRFVTTGRPIAPAQRWRDSSFLALIATPFSNPSIRAPPAFMV